MNYKDLDYLEGECIDGRQLGYNGKARQLVIVRKHVSDNAIAASHTSESSGHHSVDLRSDR